MHTTLQGMTRTATSKEKRRTKSAKERKQGRKRAKERKSARKGTRRLKGEDQRKEGGKERKTNRQINPRKRLRKTRKTREENRLKRLKRKLKEERNLRKEREERREKLKNRRKGNSKKQSGNDRADYFTPTPFPGDAGCFILKKDIRKFNQIQNWARQTKKILTLQEKAKKKKESAPTAFNPVLQALKGATNNGSSCPGKPSDKELAADTFNILNNCPNSAFNICKEAQNYPTTEGYNAELNRCKPLYDAYYAAFKEAYKKGVPCSDFNTVLTPLYDAIKDASCDMTYNQSSPGNDYWVLKMNAMQTKYDECKKKTTFGSFGYCRAQERVAAVLNYECTHCNGTQTTTMSTGRRQNRFGALFSNLKHKNLYTN